MRYIQTEQVRLLSEAMGSTVSWEPSPLFLSFEKTFLNSTYNRKLTNTTNNNIPKFGSIDLIYILFIKPLFLIFPQIDTKIGYNQEKCAKVILYSNSIKLYKRIEFSVNAQTCNINIFRSFNFGNSLNYKYFMLYTNQIQ